MLPAYFPAPTLSLQMDLVFSEWGMPGLSPAGPAPHIPPETSELFSNPHGLSGCWLFFSFFLFFFFRTQYIHKVYKSSYRNDTKRIQ